VHIWEKGEVWEAPESLLIPVSLLVEKEPPSLPNVREPCPKESLPASPM